MTRPFRTDPPQRVPEGVCPVPEKQEPSVTRQFQDSFRNDTQPGREAPSTDLLRALQRYLGEHGASLLAALRFVAGAPGEGAGRRLIEAARTASGWSRALARRVARLRGLLELEHLGDPMSPFPAPAPINPGHPAVHACCRHAEALARLIEEPAPAQEPVLPPRRPMRTPPPRPVSVQRPMRHREAGVSAAAPPQES